MQLTTSATPLDAVKVEQRPDGQADVWLRKNITEQAVEPEGGGAPRTQYTADEVHLVKAITQEEAEASFDELWDEAAAAETPQDERIKALETIAKVFSAAAPQLAQIRTAATLSIQTMAASLTDEQAISVSGLIPAFEVDKDYKHGDLLTHEGEVYRVAQDHTSQAQRVPGSGTESLYTHITLAGDSIPVWQQPTGAHDAYNTGDKVHYPDGSGPVYVSKIDGNSWSPDGYPAGWELSE
nr:MAG TPA: Chitin oligosaccharide deacetylase [Bacteriophage sp.]